MGLNPTSCDAFTLVSTLLEKLNATVVEETKNSLGLSPTPPQNMKFMKLGKIHLSFEGETLDGAKSLEDCGIKDGTSVNQVGTITVGDVPCPCCPCCNPPEGAWVRSGMKVWQVEPAPVARTMAR